MNAIMVPTAVMFMLSAKIPSAHIDVDVQMALKAMEEIVKVMLRLSI